MPLARLQARLLLSGHAHPPLAPGDPGAVRLRQHHRARERWDRTFGFRPRGLREQASASMASAGQPVGSAPASQPPAVGPRGHPALGRGRYSRSQPPFSRSCWRSSSGVRWQQPAYVMPFAGVSSLASCVLSDGAFWWSHGGAAGPGHAVARATRHPDSDLRFPGDRRSCSSFRPSWYILLLVEPPRAQSSVNSTPSSRVGTALLLTLGLVPLSLLVLLGGPVVECMPQGVESSTPIWTWLGNVAAGGGASETGSNSSSSSAPVSQAAA